MAKRKYYVVWEGVVPGIYLTWDECKAQVYGYDNAKYKSFSSLEDAEEAYIENPWKHLKSKKTQSRNSTALPAKEIIYESIAVDAACSGNPGLMEYRGVYVADNTEIFHVGPLEDGTNNIGEFLAIVHALALLTKNGKNEPIYSDSVNAIKWVENKKCNTKLKKTDKNINIFDLINRAEIWLELNSFSNKILKWETKKWGEIPADFGRK
jgi:ribonuclease HI